MPLECTVHLPYICPFKSQYSFEEIIMATTTASCPTVSAAQYHALQNPVVLPTPEELFEFEISVLKDKGLDLKSKDVDRLRKFVPNEAQMFLVVPPQPDTLDLNGLMNLIEVNGVQGENYLDVQYLKDIAPPPSYAYLLANVEDGRKRLNKKPSVSAENIAAEGRIAYSVWQGLIHGILFPCILQHHNLNLVGSRYPSDRVPYLYLDDVWSPGARLPLERPCRSGVGCAVCRKCSGDLILGLYGDELFQFVSVFSYCKFQRKFQREALELRSYGVSSSISMSR